MNAFVVIYQYRRYRTLKGDLSMVRERKDYYQLKKAAGAEPAPEVEVVVVDRPVGTDGETTAAAVDSAKRKKKKAKRVRSASEAEVEGDDGDQGVPDPADASAEVVASPPRSAREEVILLLSLLIGLLFIVLRRY